jgi:hypothetical protein
MNSDLQNLVDLYNALQDCPPEGQADAQETFKAAVKKMATAKGLNHWELSAFVQRTWSKQCLGEAKRKGLPGTPPPSIS